MKPGWDDRIASGASWSSPEPKGGTRRLAYLCLPQIRNWTKVLRSLAATSFLRCDGLAWTMELPPHALLDTFLRPQSRSANLDARGCGLAASHAERKCPSHGLAWFCHLGWGLAQERGEELHPPQPEPHKKIGLDVSSESLNKSKNRTNVILPRQVNRSLLPLNGSQRRPSIAASHRAERFERLLGQDKKFRSGSVPRGLASHWGRL